MPSHRESAYGAAGQLLTSREVARRLAVSNRTVARLVAGGHLSVVRLGRAARFREADLEALISKAAQLTYDHEPVASRLVGKEGDEAARSAD